MCARKTALTLRTVLFCLFTLPGIATAAEVSEQRQGELLHLLRHDCGSCHGMTLRGGLGPALLPETLRDKPQETLVATVLYGRAGTPMPPWRTLLSEEEVRWIIQQLVQGVN